MVITFSDGSQIAITNFYDAEAQDFAIGLPPAVGSTESVNLWMNLMNMGGGAATFDVYAYSSGSVVGSPIFSFFNPNDSDASFAFSYDTVTETLTIETDLNPNLDGVYGPLYPDGSMLSFSADSSHSTAVCYLRGTPIMTERGEVPVEQLQPGDMVLTRDRGTRPIRWIGVQRFDSRLVGQRGAPVRFQAGSLGPNVPHSDLLVSPAHAMLVDDHLVAASLLVNDVTVTQPAWDGEIEYFHVELDQHDCLLAAGAWAESYWENAGNRANFHASRGTCPDVADPHARPRPTCLPVVNASDDPRLPALRATITPRLVPARLSADADPRLEIDGARIPLMQTGPNTWQGIVPAGKRSVRLRSRSTRPSMVSDSPDHRPLGLCLYSIEVGPPNGLIPIPLDHPSLGRGFHGVERSGQRMWRWTDGDAPLPLWRFVDGATPVVITIRGHHQPLNRIADDEAAEVRAAA